MAEAEGFLLSIEALGVLIVLEKGLDTVASIGNVFSPSEPLSALSFSLSLLVG
jgi:hypothetical protein